MAFHASPQLNFYFGRWPYQGADPRPAQYIFIGEDANFAPDIETQPIWPYIVEYLRDGVAFWSKYGVHHPFLLDCYRGEGRSYHAWFSKIFNEPTPLPPATRSAISFVELLDRPTTGAGNIQDEAMVEEVRARGHFRWLAGLIFNPPAGLNRTVFLTKSVAEMLNDELALAGITARIPTPNGLNLDHGPWHQVFGPDQNRCCTVVHYHPSARFPTGAKQQLAASIRQIITPVIVENLDSNPMTETANPAAAAGSFAHYFYEEFRGHLSRIEHKQPSPQVREIMGDPNAVFVGDMDWGNVVADLGRIPPERRAYFVLSLFMITLTDQVIYTYFRAQYPDWRLATNFPKFGWSGYGPHNENPFILLWAPEREAVLNPNEVLPILPEFAQFYFTATADYLRTRLPAVAITDFFWHLAADPGYSFSMGTLAPAFRQSLEAVLRGGGAVL